MDFDEVRVAGRFRCNERGVFTALQVEDSAACGTAVSSCFNVFSMAGLHAASFSVIAVR